jgi:tRNA (mo5U34)-methyltransferase
MMMLEASAGSRPSSLRARIEALAPWFHNLQLDGIATAPDHFLGDYPRFKWQCFADALPQDLTGQSVLDIGCNGGFYSLEMKRRGADRVVSIDSDGRYLRQAALAAEVTGLSLEFHEMSVTTSRACTSGSTSSCSWACSTICAIRCWPST